MVCDDDDDESPAPEAVADGGGVLCGYSMASLVADRILRRVEEEEEGEHVPRTFELLTRTATGGEGGEELERAVTILLLSPYLTLSTNQQATGISAVAARAPVADALKVMYAVAPRGQGAAAPPVGVGGGGGGGVVSLVLPEGEACAQVVAALEASTLMLPPSARDVGKLRVGYLSVAPTWD